MKLTEEQKFVIKEILQFKKDVVKLGGHAGCGKTVVAKHLHLALPNFAVCSYTGKAADVLRKKGVKSASTIHSLIYVPEVDEYGNTIYDGNGNPKFVLAPYLPCEGVIVDEASMVSQEIYQDLCSFGIPLVFIGDHGQLDPIGQDMSLMKNPDYKLETIHRNAGEIAFFAEHIRKGFRASSFPAVNKVKYITKFQADHYLDQVDQIICAFNKTRVQVNRKARQIKGISEDKPTVGDRVMCVKNDRVTGLFNGMQGEIVHMGPGNRMRFSSDGRMFDIYCDKSQFHKEKYDFEHEKGVHPFDYAYAVTAHKFQGSEADAVLVFEQRCDLWDHRRWAYTAASRAKEQVYWVSA
jgi:exodeoxyribonuclease V